MSRENNSATSISRRWSTICLVGCLCAAGCTTPTRSPIAEQVNICGKLYQPPTTVVRTLEQPEWIPVYPEECKGTALLSPQPRPNPAVKEELSKALNVATLHLQGAPTFKFPTGQTGAVGQGSNPGVLPTVPSLSASRGSGPLGAVGQVGKVRGQAACPAGQSMLQADVYFPRGSSDLSGSEREKLSRLKGQPISYVLVEGLTEVEGVATPMSAIATRRAEVVRQVVGQSVGDGVTIALNVRTGCCTPKGEPGSSEKDDLGVSVAACVGLRRM